MVVCLTIGFGKGALRSPAIVLPLAPRSCSSPFSPSVRILSSPEKSQVATPMNANDTSSWKCIDL